ncbi:rab family, other [Fonticula alba]|uniref:Rab family, other n=1 Tax=Fonticula alba TaxID=691883 RepID=A0A058Z5F6_FONAL|nr:rab family, other [Fonticula alba]KCV69178.1 rab family, other [Fonticula alba]|eukprot:XP_009496749.1 rab family, other [Fonticula alba]
MSAAAPTALKILLIGDSGTGKTSLMYRYVDDRFRSDELATVGVDFKVRHVVVNDQCYKLLILDTAGQDRFRTLSSSYYRGAHGVILVYDITNRSSFDNLSSWFDELDYHCPPGENSNVVTMIVGNKLDSLDQCAVTTEEGQALARRRGSLFVQSSARTRVGVAQAFDHLVEKIVEKMALSNQTAAPSTQGNTVSKSQFDEAEEADEGSSCGC